MLSITLLTSNSNCKYYETKKSRTMDGECAGAAELLSLLADLRWSLKLVRHKQTGKTTLQLQF